LLSGQGGDKSQARFLVREYTNHPVSSTYFFMEALKAVGRTYAFSVFFREVETGRYFMGCVLQELGNLRILVLIESNELI